MRRTLYALAPAAAALALLVPTASPAAAVAPPGSELTLLWSRYSGVDEPHHIATLDCDDDPATGAHPDPVAACAALEGAGGEPGALPDDGRTCTEELDPVGALVVGTWGGVDVFWTASYDNPCFMARFTGGVMDFS